MGALYVVFYLVIGLLLTSNNSFCLRKERTKRAWTDVTEGEFKYLALVECSGTSCSGSITSKSTVLSYCTCGETGTTAYAGLIKKATRNDDKTQKREVTAVAAHSDLKELKVYSLDKEWDWTANVASIELHLNKTRSDAGTCTVIAFGADGAAHKMEVTFVEAKVCTATPTAGLLYSAAATPDELFTAEQHGGPAVCSGQQWGVNKEGKPKAGGGGGGDVGGDTLVPVPPEEQQQGNGNKPRRHTHRGVADCNLYVDVAHYSDWIREKSGAASIRCNSRKISVYQVLLGPLLITTVQFFLG